MKRTKRIISLLLSVMMLLSVMAVNSTAAGREPSDAAVSGLTVNGTESPLGIDSSNLSFSWQMQSDVRGQCQTAYQVLAASSLENLQAGDYTFDSGRVESSDSVGIAYGGSPLQKRTRYYWQVRVWDQDGNAVLSDPAYFETGLMEEGFAGAQWIGAASETAYPIDMDLQGAKWIWSRYGAAADKVPGETMYFRTHFTVDPQKTVKEAFLGYTSDDYGDVYINGSLAASMPQSDPLAEKWRTGAVAYVPQLLHSGDNVIAAAITNATEGYAGFIAKVLVRYTDGTEDVLVTDGNWKLTKTPAGGWEQPDADDSAWETPDQQVSYGESPWGDGVNLPDEAFEPQEETSAPMLRHTFTADKPVKDARLYATAAGIYEMSLNGEKVSGNYFDPGWTDYHKRILYQTFDVTGLVKEGENAISALLGNGWYCGNIATSGTDQYGTDPALIARLEITYQDGTTQSVVTSSDWTVYEDGPIVENDLLMGETYDATKEVPGWDLPGFDDSAWQNASEKTSEELGVGEFESQSAPSVQHMMTLPAVAMTEPQPGVYIYDFGQNFAGAVRLDVQGEAGTTIRLRHGEILNDVSGTGDGPEGTLFTANLRTAKATDYYTLKGDEAGETYQPRFTFHGFRYVEVTGLDEPLPLDAVNGIVLYSAMEEAGSFESSDALINQLYSNTLWSQRSNFIVIPTDCPQRDERLGWTGDAQVFARTATYNMKSDSFYNNYLDIVREYQREDGAYPSTAPLFWDGHGANGWGDAGVIIPWQMYQQYGDTGVIRENYDAMKAWIAYLKANSTNLIRPDADYGDWMSIVGTPSTITNTAYFAYSTHLLAKMAEAIGQTEDAAYYYDLFEQIRAAWNNAFVKEDGSMTVDTQTAYIVGLAFELFPDELRETEAKLLVDNIRQNDYHLTTGFVGTSFLNTVLSQMGYHDVAYRLLQQESYPSWLYPVTQGATTIWETWNSYSKDTGFSSGLGQNVSLNHYSYGAVCDWMYRYMLGIERDESAPGYQRFILQPTPGGTLTYAKGHYDTPYGTIESAWDLTDNTFTYEATVPANTTATLYLPAGADDILEGSVPAKEAQGVSYLGTEDGVSSFALQSGSYRFTMPLDPESLKQHSLTIENPQGVDAKAIVNGVSYDLPMNEMIDGGAQDIQIVSEDPAYSFAYVEGDLFSAENSVSLHLSGDSTLSARFAYEPDGEAGQRRTLSIQAEEGSELRINGKEATLPYSGQFADGETVSVDLKAPAGKRLAGWEEAPALGTAPALVKMDSDLSLTAVTEQIPSDQNLALHKPASSNSSEEVAGSWSINNLTDGVTTGTGYTSYKFPSADTSEDPPYFEVDLGSNQIIDQVVLYPRTDAQSYQEDVHYFPRDFTVSVRAEGEEEYTVVRSFTGHPDTDQPVTIDFDQTEARYVRVTATLLSERITAGDAPRYQMVEMEVYCTSTIPAGVEQIDVTAETDAIAVGEELVLSAETLPTFAQNPELHWMVQDAQADGSGAPSQKATLRKEGGNLILTALSEGVVDVVARAADGRGAIGTFRVTIGEPDAACSVAAVDETGNPISETMAGKLFAVRAVTGQDVQQIALFNENGMKMGLKDIVRTENGDGTATWTFRASIGTVGKNRTLTLATVDADGAYTLTDASFTLNVRAEAPQVVSASIEGTAQVNVPVTLTAITGTDVTKLEVFNENGLKMGILSQTFKDTAEGREWTVSMKIGTAGARHFTVKAVNKYGDRSEAVETNEVTIDAI